MGKHIKEIAMTRFDETVCFIVDGFPPIRNLRQARVNSLREWWLRRKQSKPQSASGDASRAAPVLWPPSGVDAEYS